jgi:hypothetical protein
MAFANIPQLQEIAMWREPLHSHQEPPEGVHTRGNRGRAIDARRRITVLGVMIAALLLVVLLALAL